MKKISLLILLISFFFLLPTLSLAEEGMVNKQDELLERQLDSLQLDEISQFWEEVVNDYGGYLPESQRGSIMDFLKGDKQFSPIEW